MFIVYKATHLPTGKIYVGQTKNKLEVRIGQHWSNTRKMTKFNLFLQNTKMEEWNWKILRTVETRKEAVDCELYHINIWNLFEEGLNSVTGYGESNEETKLKMSQKLSNYRTANPEPWNKGRVGTISDETRERMSWSASKRQFKKVYTEEEKAEKALQVGGNKEIIEVGTGKVYRSISQAAKECGMRREAIRDVVKGRRNHTGGRIFMLYDEYVSRCMDIAESAK